MLLKLAGGVTHGSQLNEVQFGLVSEDDGHNQVETMSSFMKDLHAESRFAQMTDVVQDFLQLNTNKPNMSETVL